MVAVNSRGKWKLVVPGMKRPDVGRVFRDLVNEPGDRWEKKGGIWSVLSVDR